jgi:homoserine kinase
LVAHGALAACWSGAGPSLLGICDRTRGAGVRADADDLLAAAGVAGQALLLEADTRGLTTE